MRNTTLRIASAPEVRTLLKTDAFAIENNELQKRQEAQKRQKGFGFAIFALLAFFAVNDFSHRMPQLRKSVLTSASALIFLLACCPAAFAQATGDGIWIRSAFFGEAQTFDRCLGHQPGQGQYHHHVHPICLRAQLDDNLVTISTGHTGTQYRDKAASCSPYVVPASSVCSRG